MDQNDASRLEELNKRLYQNRAHLRGDVRSKLTPPPDQTRTTWNDQVSLEDVTLMSQKRAASLAQKILFMSIVFFVGALGVAGFYFMSGSNTFSNSNIDIAVTGPVASEGGKELNLQIVITNKNPIALETADLIIEYPDGTRSAAGTKEQLTRTREFIGNIGPGEVINKTANVILYGEENSERTITYILEYRTPNSNAIYDRTKTYSVVLSSSPVSLVVDMPKEVTSNKEVTLNVRVVPNSTVSIQDTLLTVQYPRGFTFTSAEPAPASKTNIWRLGDLSPGQERILKIRGVLEGQDNDIKSFKFSAGLKKADDETTIGTAYNSIYKTITIVRPSISLTAVTNGSEAADVVVAPGQDIETEIRWANNLSEALSNVEVKTQLTGAVLNKLKVKPDSNGIYTSADNVVTWDRNSLARLETVDPGVVSSQKFGFASFDANDPAFPKGKNPVISLDITVSGTRLLPGTQAERVETRITRRVKVLTNASLSATSLYSTGAFNNTGPVPPRAEQKTTYTVLWSLKNGTSDVYGATVTGKLPANVTWIGMVSPSTEGVVYNSGTRTVTWNAGDVVAGTGGAGATKAVAFQVLLVPNLADIETTPALVTDQVFSGKDSFTGTLVSSTADNVTTSLDTDPKHVYGDGKVQR